MGGMRSHRDHLQQENLGIGLHRSPDSVPLGTFHLIPLVSCSFWLTVEYGFHTLNSAVRSAHCRDLALNFNQRGLNFLGFCTHYFRMSHQSRLSIIQSSTASFAESLGRHLSLFSWSLSFGLIYLIHFPFCCMKLFHWLSEQKIVKNHLVLHPAWEKAYYF